MSDTKFTNGEWYCVFGKTYSCVRTKSRVVADLRTVNNSYNKHDAHLLSAAPKMYELIKDLRRAVSMGGIGGGINNTEVLKTIDELLAEARGEL